MADIAINHQLYFYQLLREQVGIGRQTSPAQIERIFADDDLLPVDVGATDIDELLEALPSFLRVTTYRHGRVVVTLMRDEAFEDALAKAADKATTKSAPKGRPWKAKASRTPTPVKPKPAPSRPSVTQPEGEVDDYELAAEADRIGTSDERVAQPQASTSEAPAAQTARDGGNADAAAVVTTFVLAPSEDALTRPPSSLEQDEDNAGEQADPAVAAIPPAPDTAGQAPDVTPTDTPIASHSETPDDEASTPMPAQDLDPVNSEQPQASPEAGHITLTITYDPATSNTSEPGQPAKDADDAQTPSQHGSPRKEQARRRARGANGAAHEAPSPTPSLRLPTHISTEVWCSDAILLQLIEALDPDTDVWRVLDEAWEGVRVSEPNPRMPITFDVCASEGGSNEALSVTIRRRSPTPSGRHWELVAVDAPAGGAGDETDDAASD